MHKIGRFLLDLIHTLNFLLYMLLKENFIDYIKKSGKIENKGNNSVAVLANGPSLKKTMETYEKNEDIISSEVAVVNYFCDTEYFSRIKPEYYILSDPQFYDSECPIFEKGIKVLKTLNDLVSWKMNLYVQYCSLKMIDYNKYITNENITVVPFHTRMYSGFEYLRFKFYKKGLGSGNHGTVVLNGIYIFLNLGYKNIYLYGIDHTFFDGLAVDENNVLCSKVTHFYDNTCTLKPIVNYYYHKETNENMVTYLTEKISLFKGHKEFAEYAKYLRSNIYNCTENSLVDTYPRRKSVINN